MPFQPLLPIGILTAALIASAAVAAEPGIVPLTTVEPNGAGYLADPQPIRQAAQSSSGIQYLSGTTKAVVRCTYPLQARGCTSTPLHIDASGLRQAMAAAHVTFTHIQNVDLFQADDGAWHAAVTVGVHSASHPKHWTVVAHAQPTAAATDGPPLSWRADTLLAGDFTTPEAGNYDGKYYEEAGRLYLLYVRNSHPAPALRNEIVLQPMQSFVQAAGPAVTLLTTGDRFGELNSETFADTPSKLVEAPWLTVIGGKHALIYSTGAYLSLGYKAGVAWSDTLVPISPAGRYRKVLAPDTQGLWHSAGGQEVRYLLQSARPRWPHFVADKVSAPGVAATVQDRQGAWWLIFNGFTPGALPRLANGKVDGAQRRPFALRLRVDIPPGRSVADTSDAALATWLTPDL